MAVVAFANDEVDLSKQLLAEATSEPHLCTRALFITAALGLFAGDLQLAEAADRVFQAQLHHDTALETEALLRLTRVASRAREFGFDLMRRGIL